MVRRTLPAKAEKGMKEKSREKKKKKAGWLC